ncbi:MAG: hypothetical protein ABIY70_08645 [Capsulimonas sp.]|uniref:hypothetical protein n=1 Tax=Capsulimonas sp. TaxID=2494211 RepID=UPI003263ED60
MSPITEWIIMRFPWSKQETAATDAPPPIDVEAIARSAANAAAREVMATAADTLVPQIVERVTEHANSEAAKTLSEGIERAMTSALSPLMAPQPGVGGGPTGVYAYDNPIWYSTPQAPQRRPGSKVTVDTLRQLAESYDILRSCIQHLKREVRSVPIQIVARDAKQAEPLAAKIAEAEEFFKREGGLGGFNRKRSHFEGAILEDLIVVGAGAVFFHPRRDGMLFQAVEVDAATIRPRMDAYGWPGPNDQIWEQWIQGVLVSGYTAAQMEYAGLAENTRSFSPYPASPVEWLVMTINAALRADNWDLSFFTDGSSPSDVFSVPEGWTADQIKVWQSHWDGMLSGDTAARRKAKWVPSGSAKVGNPTRTDQDFDGFKLWLLRRTCAIMGVQPASIGYAGEQYKVSQEGSMESTSAFGAGVLLEWRKELYDDVLERLGFKELEVKNINSREEKAQERAERNKVLVGVPQKTINEARKEEGLDPVVGGDEILVPNTFITLSAAIKPPPETTDAGGDAPPGIADALALDAESQKVTTEKDTSEDKGTSKGNE